MIKKLILICILLFSAGNTIYGESDAQTTTNYYEVEYKNFGFFKTVARKIGALIGYDFLDWQEIDIKTTEIKISGSARGEIITVAANADYEDRLILSLDISSGSPKGFLDITKAQKLKPEGVQEFLKAWNYFYDESQDNFELKVSSANLLVDDNGSVHCKFTKTKESDKYVIIGKTFKKNGENNATLEIIVTANPDPILEKVTAELKSGEKIILKIMEESEIQEPVDWN